MPLLAALPIFALLAAAVALLVYWLVVLGHLLRTMSAIPTLRRGLAAPAPGSPPSVCVIVPAHNEQAVIEGLASSLVAQDYPRMSVVFALDRCTDGTKTIIERVTSKAGAPDPRFQIMEITSCPEGWAGKVNALWTAVNTAPAAGAADLLLFADADTLFDPSCVRAAVNLAHERRLDMVSLWSTLTLDRWFERWIQPAVGMELVRQYPIERANRVEGRRAFANGQFLMIARGAYRRMGGHEMVKAELVEDIHLARLAEKHGLSVGVFLADGLLRCRMYRDWAGFQRGWARIYAEAANRKPARLRRSAFRVRAVGSVLPALSAACAAGGLVAFGLGDRPLGWAAVLVGVGSLFVFYMVVVTAYRIGHAPVAGALAYPYAAWVTGSILRRAAADLEQAKPTEWGGRAYVRPAR